MRVVLHILSFSIYFFQSCNQVNTYITLILFCQKKHQRERSLILLMRLIIPLYSSPQNLVVRKTIVLLFRLLCLYVKKTLLPAIILMQHFLRDLSLLIAICVRISHFLRLLQVIGDGLDLDVSKLFVFI